MAHTLCSFLKSGSWGRTHTHLVQFSEVRVMGQCTHSPGAVFFLKSGSWGRAHTPWCSLLKSGSWVSAHTPWCSFLRSRSRGRSIWVPPGSHPEQFSEIGKMGVARAQIHLVQFFGARHTHLVQFPGVRVIGHGTHSHTAFSWGQCHWAGHTNTWCSFLGSRSLGRTHTHLVQFLQVSVIKLGTQAHLASSWGLGDRALATCTHSPVQFPALWVMRQSTLTWYSPGQML